MSNGTQPTTATSISYGTGGSNGGITDFLFDSYDDNNNNYDDTDRYSC